jgi:competence protein ComFC
MSDDPDQHRFRPIQQAQGHPGLVRLPFGRAAALLTRAALDLVFPPRCAGCGRVDTPWCDRCQHELDQLPPLAHVQRLPPLRACAATGVYDGKLASTIQSLKYENATALAVPLGVRLVTALAALNWTFDMIIPVPLHTNRLRQRGYNQSQLLGEHVAEHLTLPCNSSALMRRRNTPAQVGLTRPQRHANMQDAFAASTPQVSGCSILLIDDVYTTGATLQACATALKDAGAASVYSLTVAVARL